MLDATISLRTRHPFIGSLPKAERAPSLLSLGIEYATHVRKLRQPSTIGEACGIACVVAGSSSLEHRTPTDPMKFHKIQINPTANAYACE
jgi:hypothetical protein